MRGLIEELEQHGTASLQFELPGGRRVPGNYHITYVKREQVRSVDCGGQREDRELLVLQLLPAGSGEAMSAAKAADILRRSFNLLADESNAPSVSGSGEWQVECDVATETLARYRLALPTERGDECVVRLESLSAVCAPAAMKGIVARGRSCCG